MKFGAVPPLFLNKSYTFQAYISLHKLEFTVISPILFHPEKTVHRRPCWRSGRLCNQSTVTSRDTHRESRNQLLCRPIYHLHLLIEVTE